MSIPDLTWGMSAIPAHGARLRFWTTIGSLLPLSQSRSMYFFEPDGGIRNDRMEQA
jgi:hypothetical protein